MTSTDLVAYDETSSWVEVLGPAAVLADVRNEYVSIEGAERDYGVVIDPISHTVDETATRRVRAARTNGK